MDKKTMAVILAAITLSVGSGLAMEKAETQNNSNICAPNLDYRKLNILFDSGEFFMPRTQNKFKLSSGNQDALLKVFKEQEFMKEDRVGIFEKAESQGDEITCHYTYRGGKKRAFIPSATGYHTKFSVTSVSRGTENLPLMQQEQPYSDLPSKETPVSQPEWEKALTVMGIKNPANFRNYDDVAVMSQLYSACKKKAEGNDIAMQECIKATATIKRALREWNKQFYSGK